MSLSSFTCTDRDGVVDIEVDVFPRRPDEEMAVKEEGVGSQVSAVGGLTPLNVN